MITDFLPFSLYFFFWSLENIFFYVMNSIFPLSMIVLIVCSLYDISFSFSGLCLGMKDRQMCLRWWEQEVRIQKCSVSFYLTYEMTDTT